MRVCITYGSLPHEQFIGDVASIAGRPLNDLYEVPVGSWVRMTFDNNTVALMNLTLARAVQEVEGNGYQTDPGTQ